MSTKRSRQIGVIFDGKLFTEFVYCPFCFGANNGFVTGAFVFTTTAGTGFWKRAPRSFMAGMFVPDAANPVPVSSEILVLIGLIL